MHVSVRRNRNVATLRFFILFAILFLILACSRPDADKKPDAPSGDFTLTVLHTNDTHSHYGGVTDKGSTCYAALCEDGRGGYVRLDQTVRAIRKDTPDALFLEAGDIFLGTLFWGLHKERVPVAVLDKMGYQAITPGNHEFDDGWPRFLRMVEALKTPIVAANLTFAPSVRSPAVSSIRPFIVLERSGRKIGIVGITNPWTPETSLPGPEVNFGEAKQALEESIAKLAAEDVNIIIALTHLGLQSDKLLARSVNGVDIIVGGHSHTLLSNTDDKAEGPYPVVEKTPDGSPVLVVTASTACLYLGKLEIEFDDKGIARQWRGGPILLDQATLDALNAPEPDAELVKILNDFAAPAQKEMVTAIGVIKAKDRDGNPLEERSVKECRRVECLSGNIITDALRDAPFAEAQVALVNGGVVRASLPGGTVTRGNLLDTLPFKNTAVMTEMSGAILLQTLEHGVSAHDHGDGRFLQVSGLRYAFKPSNKVGKRITQVEVQEKNGQWSPLSANAVYNVVTVEYIAEGGDEYAVLSKLPWNKSNKRLEDITRDYIERHSPLKIELQGRITVLQ